jgi:hypothetical protein
MAHVVSLSNYRQMKLQSEQDELASYDTLDCWLCERPVTPHLVEPAHVVHYSCTGVSETGEKLHKKLDWRIDEDGDVLKGHSGNRYA